MQRYTSYETTSYVLLKMFLNNKWIARFYTLVTTLVYRDHAREWRPYLGLGSCTISLVRSQSVGYWTRRRHTEARLTVWWRYVVRPEILWSMLLIGSRLNASRNQTTTTTTTLYWTPTPQRGLIVFRYNMLLNLDRCNCILFDGVTMLFLKLVKFQFSVYKCRVCSSIE